MTHPMPQSQDVSSYHQNSDQDSSSFAQHHTLGINNVQASPGDHNHNGRNSKQIANLDILGHPSSAFGTTAISIKASSTYVLAVGAGLLASLYIIPFAVVHTISQSNALIIEGVDDVGDFVLGSVGASRLPRGADGSTYAVGTLVDWRWIQGSGF